MRISAACRYLCVGPKLSVAAAADARQHRPAHAGVQDGEQADRCDGQNGVAHCLVVFDVGDGPHRFGGVEQPVSDVVGLVDR